MKATFQAEGIEKSFELKNYFDSKLILYNTFQKTIFDFLCCLLKRKEKLFFITENFYRWKNNN